ncbi:MAG: XisH family protein [Cyanobacteria bacterium P01_A01_bin.68]
MNQDIFHDVVKAALEKEGLNIIDDPLYLRFGGLELYIDLGAQKLIAAQKGEEKIAVEIKRFVGNSATTEFSTALGQFLKYQVALQEEQPGRILYLAIPLDTYRSFFNLELPKILVDRYQVNLIVYDPKKQVILTWRR